MFWPSRKWLMYWKCVAFTLDPGHGPLHFGYSESYQVFRMVRLGAPVIFCCFLLSIAWCASPANAQLSHREVMVDIALKCLAPALDNVEKFSLQGKGLSRIVSSDVTSALIRNGYQLVGTKATAQRLIYNVELASVELSAKGRKKLKRRVTIGLSYELSEASGDGITDAGSCSDNFTDVVDRRAVEKLGYQGFPETNPSIPSAGGVRRYLEPIILVGASAMGTYLFFNLRSRRTSRR